MFDNFTKIYSDKPYKYSTLVRHKGIVLSFAMDAARRLFYTVLDLSHSTPQNPLDVHYWLENPRELRFTNEIAEVGFGVADQTPLPTLKLGSRDAVAPGIRVRDDEKDFFLSTTARLTADAPFQVLSDGKYLYLFRQAIDAAHPDNVMKSGVALVNSTLLVDRFVMVGTELKPKMEVRYQRSRSKFRPQNRKDSLNAKDMEGQPFFEPTQELTFVRNLSQGRFTALLLPTQVVNVQRWQIFAHNAQTGFMESYNVERAADGLFNTQGTQFYTCTDHADVFELRPGTCVEPRVGNETLLCDKDLIPFASGSGRAESALKMPTTAVINLEKAITPTDKRTIEYWLFPTDATASRLGKYLLEANQWNHLAVTLDGGIERFYLNGTLQQTPTGTTLNITNKLVENFAGVVDEVRLWDFARSGKDIRAAMNQRLTGFEPGLRAYWRFDEGTGFTVHDQTNNGLLAKQEGGEWIASDAPLGENPGIRRDRLRFAGRNIASGPAALLYYQQEKVAGGYDGQAKPLKQKARVMLTVATSIVGPNENKIAALDFGVSREGRLAQTPDVVTLPASTAADSSGSINDQLDSLSRLEAQVRQTEADLTTIKLSIAAHTTALALIDDALNRNVVKLGTFSGDLSSVNPKLTEFQQAEQAISPLVQRQNDLINAQATARVTLYEHSEFRGRGLTFGLGFVGFTTLNANGFNDRISSLTIPEPLQVRAFEHANRGGASNVFSGETSFVGDDWNDRISSLDIETNPTFADKLTTAANNLAAGQTRLNTARNALTQERATLQARKQSLEQEQRTKENLLSTRLTELRAVNAKLKGDVIVPMALLNLDPQGLTVTGRLLDFAFTADTPQLFDSATGNLALYFRGLKDQFFVAYYDTQTARAEYKLTAENGTITCQARSSETELDALTITVSGAKTDKTCKVVIAGVSGITETWEKVPRQAERFADVLNGLAGAREFVGKATAAEGTATVLTVIDGVARALEAGTTLFAGTTRLTTTAAVAQGATEIPITSTALALSEGTALFAVAYDYATNAKTTKALCDLSNGSLFARAYSAGARGDVLVTHKDADNKEQPNQTATSGKTLSCQWRGRPPGRTLAFDGDQRFARLIQKDKAANFAAPGDVTMEAWCKPGDIPAKARLIQQRSDQSHYALGLQRRERFSALEFIKADGGPLGLGNLFGAQNAFVQIPPNAALTFAGAITMEAWINPKALTGIQYIIFHDEKVRENFSLRLMGKVFLRIREGNYEVGSFQPGAAEIVATAAAPTGDVNTWVHLAGVYDDVAKRWLLYRNGVEIGRADSAVGAVPLNNSWVLGAQIDTAASLGLGLFTSSTAKELFFGQMDEVRIWNVARSSVDINADKNRRLRGNDIGLVGCWRFDDGLARDHSVQRNDGRVMGNTAAVLSPLPVYAAFAGIGEQFVQTRATIPSGNWSHVAAVFNQSYALRFDGKRSDYLDAGNDITLDLNRDLTLEVFLQPDALRRPLGILAKGMLDDGTKQDVPYLLALDDDNTLVFAFEDTNHVKHVLATAGAVPSGFCKLAVTRRHVIEPVGDKIVIYDEIKLFINGRQQKLKTPASDTASKLNSLATAAKAELQLLANFATAVAVGVADDIGALQAGLDEEGRKVLDALDATAKQGVVDNLKAVRTAVNGLHTSPLGFFALLAPLWGDFVDDGKTYRYKGKSAGSNNQPLEIGRAYLIGAQEALFKGVISEVRAWNAARDAKDVCSDINGSEKGLVSWWRLEENEGNAATDSKSNNHARIKGDVAWVKNPDPNGSTLALYLDGVNVPVEARSKTEFTDAQVQLTLGALDNATAADKFQGEMEEVRVWKIPRTTEQIQDNLFRRLTGEKEDLIAHYTFDVAPNEVGFAAATNGKVTTVSVPKKVQRALRANTILWVGGTRVTVSQDVTANADSIPIQEAQLDVKADTVIFEMAVPDHSLRGNHLQLSAAPSDAMFTLSTAPISEDAPQIRSALAGIKTDFNETMQGRPAAEEYGEMQYDVDGNLIGVHKRCYSIIKNGQWQLITAYKVGDLVTEWVGQVQFAPQLIGYIEGAPPVPSENLTTRSVEAIGDADDYNQASTVEIVTAKRTTFTYSAEKEAGFDVSLDLTARAGVKSESLGGPLVAVTSFEDTNFQVGVKSGMEYSQSWLKDASTSVGQTVTRASSLELRGRFENPGKETQPKLGRRFIPDNVGLALVQSETADVFALRLQHNNALVSYQMRPNPDIPKDWNIITFPINPRYTKQGTLDGKVGFQPDASYPNALTYSPDSSYFKPIEAYALKHRIQREEEELRTFYEQFSPASTITQAGAIAATGGALIALTGGLGAIGGAGLGLLANELSNAAVDNLPRLEKRNIVNTYVWTADGGLFAETQETMDVWQETTGGSFNASAKAGLSLSADIAISKVAFQFELEAMLGAHLNLTLKKSEETENTFALNVALEKVERDVYERDAKGQIQLDTSDERNPKPIKKPGKVDAYRFMTFYLEPRTNNFDLFFNRVVDPIWLEQSDDPNAVALREAQQDAFRPPCWRVLHRVTYVSRTLEPFTAAPPSALDKAMQDLNVASNYELIKVLEPFVRDKRGFVAFADAVRQTLTTYLPELQPHAETIIQYASLYFGVIEEEGISANDPMALAAASTLAPAQQVSAEAGTDQVIRMEQGAALLGEVANAATTKWSMISGSGTTTFDDATARATVARFSQRGVYRLRLTAASDANTVSDELTIVVNEAPVIDAGQNLTLNLNGKAELVGVVSDNGLGNPRQGQITTQWEMVSGPAAATFANAKTLATTATFTKAGSYLLRLTVNNGTHTVSDEIVVNVVGRVVSGLQALYAFEESRGLLVRDVSGVGAPLDLTVGDRQAVSRVKGGLRIKSATTVESLGPATKISEAVRATGELTIEAWIKPGENVADDLSRIVTISDGHATRNFTLAQTNGSFYAGLRTTMTDLSASNKALSGKAPTNSDLSHLVCTRDATGQTRLYLNAVEIASRKVNGDFGNWEPGFKLALASELPKADEAAPRHTWLGDYHLVALYSRALSSEEVQQNFAFGANTNLAPAVEAGADQVVDLPAVAQLSGSVTDDRAQADEAKVQWTKLSGPGAVTFGTPDALTTTAAFTRSGVYTLRLTAGDDELSNSDTITIVVHQAPTIKASAAAAAQPLLLTAGTIALQLEGTIFSTGLGEAGQSQATMQWERASGPDGVTFTDVAALNTTATFTKHGNYVLRLTVSNGRLTTSSDVTIQVTQPPIVNVGADQVINLPATAKLRGAIDDTGTDDAQAPLTVQWTATGPGAVTFADPQQLNTTASFARNGVYVLRLTASNGSLSAHDEVTVIANQPPFVSAGQERTVLASSAELEGIVSDDGFPDPPGVVTVRWEKVSGAGEVFFSDPASAFTLATFLAKGAYTLRLTADDGASQASDEVNLTVQAAPTIAAGTNQTVKRNALVTLQGAILDTGLVPPQTGDVTTQWTQTAGPATVAIANATALFTTVNMPAIKGDYRFQLSATNGLLTATDEVQITVR
ncbi:MAG TPA: LamG-like jellyroll fold domain-containing protein [Blastocatellia bacterium]|nr:LamG-like jellyroll fold domain-containing protein [Blastocatellia bacterium]